MFSDLLSDSMPAGNKIMSGLLLGLVQPVQTVSPTLLTLHFTTLTLTITLTVTLLTQHTLHDITNTNPVTRSAETEDCVSVNKQSLLGILGLFSSVDSAGVSFAVPKSLRREREEGGVGVRRCREVGG